MGMRNDIDPYTPTESVFECVECHHRVVESSHRGNCSECGATVVNIAVSRE